MELKNKKVLLVGLGILGGGLSMAKYLIEHGADLTITDLRSNSELAEMIKKLPKNISYTLGEHHKEDFDTSDIIIFNPAVSYFSEWPQYAQKTGKEFYNDYTFFLKILSKVKPEALIVGITGTRGKTTTAMWTAHLIPDAVLGGNIPDKNLLKIIDPETDIYILELSSFQLEYATTENRSPNIAALTNIYTDHLNRYGTFDKYQEVKFNIFKNQTEDDVLVLNADETVTKTVLSRKPESLLFFTSKKPLSKNHNGLYFDGDHIYYQYEGQQSLATTATGLAPHEKDNLLFAMLIAHLVGVDGKEIAEGIKELPAATFRQQKIFEDKKITIINDSAGTSPEATMAAIEKYRNNNNFVLISGGTDKALEFKPLAQKIAKDVKPENLYLLEGSGTELLMTELEKITNNELVPYPNLEDIIDVISQEYETATIVFSPGCASFEKFKNEFDRGETFNRLVKKYF